jgi:hypothetical protein
MKMKRITTAVLLLLAGMVFMGMGYSTHAQEREEMSHASPRTVLPSDLVDLSVNVELYGVSYTLTVGPYDRFAAEDIARQIVTCGLRYTSATTTPPANYLYAPNTIRYVHFVNHPPE